jgi:hypothetical protein
MTRAWAVAALATFLLSAPALGAPVTYSKDIAPLLAERCGMCHHA